MIRTRRNHWERHPLRDAIGWLIAALIPLVVAAVVALSVDRGE